MTTVRQLIAHLEGIDPDVPVGVIDIVRAQGSPFMELRLHDLVDIDTVHDRTSGEPLAVWLTARTPSIATADRLCRAVPPVVLIESHRCGCLLPVSPSRQNPRRNLDAVACAHFVPSAVTVRGDALFAEESDRF